MTPLSEPEVRIATSEDLDAMASFAWSTGALYEDDVEGFIRNDLRETLEQRRPHYGTEALVVVDRATQEILAVGVHEEVDMQDEDGHAIVGSYLMVGAVTRNVQGQVVDCPPLVEGEGPPSVGRYLMEAVVGRAVDAAGRQPVIHALVDPDNVRSLGLCKRLGLEVRGPDPTGKYLELFGTVR